jgi:hypothetical protein
MSPQELLAINHSYEKAFKEAVSSGAKICIFNHPIVKGKFEIDTSYLIPGAPYGKQPIKTFPYT